MQIVIFALFGTIIFTGQSLLQAPPLPPPPSVCHCFMQVINILKHI